MRHACFILGQCSVSQQHSTEGSCQAMPLEAPLCLMMLIAAVAAGGARPPGMGSPLHRDGADERPVHNDGVATIVLCYHQGVVLFFGPAVRTRVHEVSYEYNVSVNLNLARSRRRNAASCCRHPRGHRLLCTVVCRSCMRCERKAGQVCTGLRSLLLSRQQPHRYEQDHGPLLLCRSLSGTACQ